MGQQQYIPPAAAAAAPLFACEKTNAEKICSRDIFPPEARRIARGVGWRRERVGSKKAVSGCSRGRPSWLPWAVLFARSAGEDLHSYGEKVKLWLRNVDVSFEKENSMDYV